MSTLQTEIQDFLAATGCKQIELAKAAGISPSSICNLLKGRRKELVGSRQDRLREAMRRLGARKNRKEKK